MADLPMERGAASTYDDNERQSEMEGDVVSAEKGFIYVMSNPMFEGCYKIGASTNDPVERARQLSASSGVPYPYTVAYQRLVDAPFQVEAALHRMLDQYRLNDSREFFRVRLSKIITLAESYEEVRWESLEYDREYRFAKLFSTFPDDGPRELTQKEQERCRELERTIAEEKEKWG